MSRNTDESCLDEFLKTVGEPLTTCGVKRGRRPREHDAAEGVLDEVNAMSSSDLKARTRTRMSRRSCGWLTAEGARAQEKHKEFFGKEVPRSRRGDFLSIADARVCADKLWELGLVAAQDI